MPVDRLNPHWERWSQRAKGREPEGWADMVEHLAGLQDAVAAAVPPDDVVAEVHELLARATALLTPHHVEDEDQIFGRLLDHPSRGQSLVPPIHYTERGEGQVRAWTRFGPFHSGHNGAVHGGAVANMFDDVLGRTADMDGTSTSRTAFLRLDFRSLTPLDRRLTVKATVEEQSGRKRFLHGTLHDGDRLCVEATALFVELLPGQP